MTGVVVLVAGLSPGRAILTVQPPDRYRQQSHSLGCPHGVNWVLDSHPFSQASPASSMEMPTLIFFFFVHWISEGYFRLQGTENPRNPRKQRFKNVIYFSLTPSKIQQ